MDKFNFNMFAGIALAIAVSSSVTGHAVEKLIRPREKIDVKYNNFGGTRSRHYSFSYETPRFADDFNSAYETNKHRQRAEVDEGKLLNRMRAQVESNTFEVYDRSEVDQLISKIARDHAAQVAALHSKIDQVRAELSKQADERHAKYEKMHDQMFTAINSFPQRLLDKEVRETLKQVINEEFQSLIAERSLQVQQATPLRNQPDKLVAPVE